MNLIESRTLNERFDKPLLMCIFNERPGRTALSGHVE